MTLSTQHSTILVVQVGHLLQRLLVAMEEVFTILVIPHLHHNTAQVMERHILAVTAEVQGLTEERRVNFAIIVTTTRLNQLPIMPCDSMDLIILVTLELIILPPPVIKTGQGSTRLVIITFQI